MKITAEQLRQIFELPVTSEKPRIYTNLLNTYMDENFIDNYPRICAFLAQIGHESGRLRYTEEIASGAAYEGRKDLGNIITGYGVKYKGRGLIQITGYYNYREMGGFLNLDLVNQPKILATPLWATASACVWWKSRGLNQLADKGEFKKITKIINGGYNGLADRLQLYNRALKILAEYK